MTWLGFTAMPQVRKDRSMQSTGVWRELRRDGARLAIKDYGGGGPTVLLMHGLAGESGEWDATAAALLPGLRVVAFDQRGHGRSERRPTDVSRAAFVADAAAVATSLGVGPVVVAGQSLGGHTAMLMAARHPGLVRGLAVADASPSKGSPSVRQEVVDWLRSWPVPFTDRDAANAFLPHPAWVDGLEWRADGGYPQWDADVMTAALADDAPHWAEWEAIRCPAVLVRGARGIVPEAEAHEMRARLPSSRMVTVDTGHDVHLEATTEWAAELAALAQRGNEAD